MKIVVKSQVLIHGAADCFLEVRVENFLADLEGKSEHELAESGGWACRVHCDALLGI